MRFLVYVSWLKQSRRAVFIVRSSMQKLATRRLLLCQNCESRELQFSLSLELILLVLCTALIFPKSSSIFVFLSVESYVLYIWS